MIKKISATQDRANEILRLGKEGKTTLKELADVWNCSTLNILDYLRRLQEKGRYAYWVDGRGYFRIFQEIE
jgi:MarR-like DNA-binding transcriptional regulator SgrR of sgrS sRNA